MKRTLLTLAMTIATFLGFQANINAQTTKTYTNSLTITSNHVVSVPQPTEVEIIYVANDKINLNIKRLDLGGGAVVNNIKATELNLQQSSLGIFNFFQSKQKSNVEGFGELDIDIKGQINDENLYFVLSTDLTALGIGLTDLEFGNNFTAKLYTKDLTVQIDEAKTDPQPANVIVSTNEDGTMNLTLKNFQLTNDETAIPVGNIKVTGLALTSSEYGTYNTFERDETIKLDTGDPTISDMWLATTLNDLYGGVPIIMKGQISDDDLYVTIDIDMKKTALEQYIYVEVGEPWKEEIKTFTISFVVDGTTIQSSELEAGASITVPTMEEREGYTFEWIDEIPSTISDNLTINGQYVPNKYWVQFFVDGVAVYEMEQEYGTPISVPEVEEREGYTFAWEGEIPATVPAEPVLVLGYYTANTYTITFMLDGQEYARYDLEYGTAITAPDVASDDRYTFSGWDEVPETMPAHDVVVSGGMVDGLSKIETGKKKVQRAYDLGGRLINIKHAQRKGVIIVNGKKVLVR